LQRKCFRNCRNSCRNAGGACSNAPPFLAARGFTCRHWCRKRADLPCFLLLCPSLPKVRDTTTCKIIKTQHRQLILVFISFVFQIFFGFFPFLNLSRFSASSADRSSSSSFGGRSVVEDPASWVRRRRRCYGKETPLQGWQSLLLEAGLRVRGSPSSPLFQVADRVCERGAVAGSLMTGGRDDRSWLVCGRCCWRLGGGRHWWRGVSGLRRKKTKNPTKGGRLLPKMEKRVMVLGFLFVWGFFVFFSDVVKIAPPLLSWNCRQFIGKIFFLASKLVPQFLCKFGP